MYKYYSQFHMTQELEMTLSKLISVIEERDYICKRISSNIHNKNANNYEYIAVMESLGYQNFINFPFNNKEDVYNILKSLSIIFSNYNGIFNSNIFYKRFPYLKDFFIMIDKWRAETGRVSIDNEILEHSYKKTLKLNKYN